MPGSFERRRPKVSVKKMKNGDSCMGKVSSQGRIHLEITVKVGNLSNLGKSPGPPHVICVKYFYLCISLTVNYFTSYLERSSSGFVFNIFIALQCFASFRQIQWGCQHLCGGLKAVVNNCWDWTIPVNCPQYGSAYLAPPVETCKNRIHRQFFRKSQTYSNLYLFNLGGTNKFWRRKMRLNLE